MVQWQKVQALGSDGSGQILVLFPETYMTLENDLTSSCLSSLVCIMEILVLLDSTIDPEKLNLYIYNN
jgi:hypothetical protein